MQHALRIFKETGFERNYRVHLSSWKIASFSSEPSGAQRPHLVVAVFEDGLSRWGETRKAKKTATTLARWLVGSLHLQTMAAAHLTQNPSAGMRSLMITVYTTHLNISKRNLLISRCVYHFKRKGLLYGPRLCPNQPLAPRFKEC